MKSIYLGILIALTCLATSGPLRAQGDDVSTDTATEASETDAGTVGAATVGRPLADRIKAVSRKSFLKKNRFELTPALGLSVNDAFFRNYILQVDATYHIVESFSLELRLGLPVFGEALAPVEFLRSQYKTLTNIVRPAYLVQVAGNFTPLYGKVALFSEWIWQYDLYIAGGAGVTGIGILQGANLDMGALAHVPSANVGVGMRSFINRWMVIHVDARDYIYPAVTDGLSTVQNLMVISVGVGFFFPLDFDYEYEGYKVVS